MEYVSTFKNRLIYIFRINDEKHKGCLKIGEATAPDGFFSPNSKELNDAAKKRINQYTQTAGIRYELLHTEMTLFTKNGKVRSFNDSLVRDILYRSGYKQKCFDIDGKSNEWVICDLETAKNAIEAAKNSQESLSADKKSTKKSPIVFRPEQQRAIEQTKRVFKKGKEILWNAKMRMGKTLSSLQVVKELNVKRTIIVTHRPVVDEGWYEDFGKIFFESNTQFLYGSKNKGTSNIKKLDESGKNYVYFASIQDLRGSKRVGGKFEKDSDIFDTEWDLLIIDEAHEGTQTQLGQKVKTALVKEKTKIINLSGTPFNLIDDFDEETTFTWDYTMEQRAKEEWYREHPLDPNPYEELPKLNILTFSLGELKKNFEDEDKAFNFREFFRTWTGCIADDHKPIPKNAKPGNFVHEKEVLKFLDIISSEEGETLYPFSKPQYREYFRHTFWIIPGVKEGAALAELLRSHRFFGTYEVINIAGKEDEELNDRNDALNEVLTKIGDAPENTQTITLSCGKLTTGVTVKPWTAVLYLAGSKNTSPQTYMQTIFRVQSPARIAGRMKTDCYVFDFAPDRTLKMIAETAKISAKAGGTSDEDRVILGEFLNFCPIIACEGTKMRNYNVDQMLQQLKRVYVDKVVNSGFDDGHLYSDKLLNLSDVELEAFAQLRGIIGSTKANNIPRDIEINNEKFDKEDIAKKQKEEKKKKKHEITPEEALRLLQLEQKKRQRDIAVSILRGISIRMPLLLYGAKLDSEEDEISLDRFVQLVDDKSWEEFMPKGVDKATFAEYRRYYDEDIFSAAGKQIRRLAYAADNMSVLDRIQRISEIFSAFRNPDKETVLTPWRVVNMHLSDTLGGYCFYDEKYKNTIVEPIMKDRGLVTQRIFENPNVKVLEINSKSGLYPLYMAYSIFRHRLKTKQEIKRRTSLFASLTLEEEQQIWNNVLEQNIFVICKTEMARQITKRTLAGFSDTKVNTHVYDDLLMQITNKQKEFITKLSNGQIFKQIRSNMKFDVVVGNPPYQVTDGSGAAGDAAIAVYNKFVEVARNIKPQYISLIMPSKWMVGGRGLQKFREDFSNDQRIEKMYDYEDSAICFSNQHIDGGICYFLWNKDHSGMLDYVYQTANGEISQEKRFLKNDTSNIVIRDSRRMSLVGKIGGCESFMKIVSYTQPFGVRKDLFNNPEKYKDVRLSENPIKNSVLIWGVKGIKGGARRKSVFVDRNFITKNTTWIDRYKLLFTTSYSTTATVPPQPILANPGVVGTETFLVIGPFDTETEMKNCYTYIKTKFFRLYLYFGKGTMQVSKEVFQFVPLQDFTSKSDIDWSLGVEEIDRLLYKKYNFSPEEIDFTESMIKPM